jgi:hypothetical protein
MRKTFARLQSLAHPDFKPQEVETFLFGTDHAGLSLVKGNGVRSKYFSLFE